MRQIIPRTLTKEVFRYVFSTDGETPISYKTLYRYYIRPHLQELEISSCQFKAYQSGIPYHVNRKLISIHQISSEELFSALEQCQQARSARRRVLIRASK